MNDMDTNPNNPQQDNGIKKKVDNVKAPFIPLLLSLSMGICLLLGLAAKAIVHWWLGAPHWLVFVGNALITICMFIALIPILVIIIVRVSDWWHGRHRHDCK